MGVTDTCSKCFQERERRPREASTTASKGGWAFAWWTLSLSWWSSLSKDTEAAKLKVSWQSVRSSLAHRRAGAIRKLKISHQGAWIDEKIVILTPS